MVAFTAALVLAALPFLASAAPASNQLEGRALPTPYSAATARSALAGLTVRAEANAATYDRDAFNHWITISGSCDTRETVLKRDGTNVVQSSSCSATSGSWRSAYDGVTTSDASSFDIDHVIPLAEAWRSGASSWTASTRQAFANDLTRPQLIAVSASSNRSKGDQDPANWLPPLSSYHCTYARAWVQDYYNLSVDSAEKSALQSILNGC